MKLLGTIQLFYDGPEQPTSIFDAFLTILSTSEDIGPQSYLELVQTASGTVPAGTRPVGFTLKARTSPHLHSDKDVYNAATINTLTSPIYQVIVNESSVSLL
jgi:hypothetical protein